MRSTTGRTIPIPKGIAALFLVFVASCAGATPPFRPPRDLMLRDASLVVTIEDPGVRRWYGPPHDLVVAAWTSGLVVHSDNGWRGGSPYSWVLLPQDHVNAIAAELWQVASTLDKNARVCIYWHTDHVNWHKVVMRRFEPSIELQSNLTLDRLASWPAIPPEDVANLPPELLSDDPKEEAAEAAFAAVWTRVEPLIEELMAGDGRPIDDWTVLVDP
jgi:hypothetical protein